MCKKILIVSKNDSNKSCAKLNFRQKTQWKHISMYPEWRLRTSKIWCNFISSIWKRTDTSKSYCFILICFSTNIKNYFHWTDKIHNMIFEWMYTYRSQLHYRITQWNSWIDVKVFLPFQCFIFQKQKIFGAL